MNIDDLSITELESLAFRLIEERDRLTSNLNLVQGRIKILRQSIEDEIEKTSDSE